MLSNVLTTLNSIHNLSKQPHSNKVFIIPETGALCEQQKHSFVEGFFKLFHDSTPTLMRKYNLEAGDKKIFVQRCNALASQYKKAIKQCGKDILWAPESKKEKNEQRKLVIIDIYTRFNNEHKPKEWISCLTHSFAKDEEVERALLNLIEKIETSIEVVIKKNNIDIEHYLKLKQEEEKKIHLEKKLTQLPNIETWVPPNFLELKVNKKNLPTNEMVSSINSRGLINKLELYIGDLCQLAQQLELLFPKLMKAIKWENQLVIDIDSVEIISRNEQISQSPPPPPIMPQTRDSQTMEQAIRYHQQKKECQQLEEEFCKKYKRLIDILFMNELRQNYELCFTNLPLINELNPFIEKTITFNQKEVEKLQSNLTNLQPTKTTTSSIQGYLPLVKKINQLRTITQAMQTSHNHSQAILSSKKRLERAEIQISLIFSKLKEEQEKITVECKKNKEKIQEELEKSETIKMLNQTLENLIKESEETKQSIFSLEEKLKNMPIAVKDQQEIARFAQIKTENPSLSILLSGFKRKTNEYLKMDVEEQKKLYLQLYGKK